jgi:phenylalanyl-tRNA synthetase alpha subunit
VGLNPDRLTDPQRLIFDTGSHEWLLDITPAGFDKLTLESLAKWRMTQKATDPLKCFMALSDDFIQNLKRARTEYTTNADMDAVEVAHLEKWLTTPPVTKKSKPRKKDVDLTAPMQGSTHTGKILDLITPDFDDRKTAWGKRLSQEGWMKQLRSSVTDPEKPGRQRQIRPGGTHSDWDVPALLVAVVTSKHFKAHQKPLIERAIDVLSELNMMESVGAFKYLLAENKVDWS